LPFSIPNHEHSHQSFHTMSSSAITPHADLLQPVGPSESVSHVPSARRVFNVETILMGCQDGKPPPIARRRVLASYKESRAGHWFANIPGAPLAPFQPFDRSFSHSLEYSIMYISRSLLVFASVLSFSIHTSARVAQHHIDSASDNALEAQKSEKNKFSQKWPLSNIFRKRQDNSTTEIDWTTLDLYKNILDDGSPSDITMFCNIWLGLPPATTVVEFTPIMYAIF
jgi:hypothetical protein